MNNTGDVMGKMSMAAMGLALAVNVGFGAVTLTPQEGVFGMVTRPQPQPKETLAPVELKIAGSGAVTVRAADFSETPLAWSQSLTLTEGEPQTIRFPAPSWGYYRLAVTADGAEVASAEVGVIPKPHPGVRKESFFASNVWAPEGDKLKLFQALGMRVQRNHFQGLDDAWFKRAAEQLRNLQAHDTWLLPLSGYAFPDRKAELAEKLKMHGPPDDFQFFVDAWEKILTAFPEINTAEFWNEPWIFGWTWAATPEEYRTLQKMWCEMARRVNPNLRILAGNSSMFTEDHIEHTPSCWKGLIDGTTHHPYSGCGNAHHRSGQNLRTVDMGYLITRRMGLPYYYLTEGGSEFRANVKGKTTPDGKPVTTQNNRENARNLVQYFVRAALIGAYQGNVQWDIGYGEKWTLPNTALAMLTHMTEDRPPVAEIWPHHQLIQGGIFANPRHITPAVRALPRAQELSVRWDVPVPDDRKADATKVAIVWALTGTSNDSIDTAGTLTMNARDLTAYDMLGREIPANGRTLTVPFTLDPVYIVSDKLSVIELKKRVGDATIGNITPLNMYAFSLTQPADRAQTLSVRMQNQLNVAIKGTLTMQAPGTRTAVKAPFAIPSGELAEIALPWQGAPLSPDNQYAIHLSAQIDGKAKWPPVTRSQIIATAQFAKRTITLTGSPDDWAGVTPVTILTNGAAKALDLTQYYLNPHLAKPDDLTLPQPDDGVKLYAAYDDTHVYIAIQGLATNNTAGTPWATGRAPGAELPFKKGTQDGLTHVAYCGDSAQLAFGFRDRVPGYGRQMDDPYAWKGHFYDTDYLYSAHTSATGDTLNREWGADTTRRSAYQLDAPPGTGPIPGATIKITDHLYEIAIPRAELKLFDPATLDRFRFSVNLNRGTLHWSESAGVFDYWYGTGSFSPSWEACYPNQTYWGIEK